MQFQPAMTPIQKLAALSDDQLARQDPAAVNLACVPLLETMGEPDFPGCRKTLDEMAKRATEETNRLRHLFDREPEKFKHSLARFRAEVLVTVLQRDFDLQYEIELNELKDAVFYRNPENLFLHGALRGCGTCSSIPPVYLAVGWRLGYPIKLVTCRQHHFARWDGDGERFNIECTCRGFVSHPDEHYRTWPKPLTDKQVVDYQALRSLSPREAFAVFMNTRGICWQENGCLREAVGAFASAAELHHESWSHSDALTEGMNAWDRELRRCLPPGFPSMTLIFPQRWYKHVPREMELGIVHMITKENLLTRAEYKIRWWQPLRRNPAVRPKGLPAHITVEYPKAAEAAQGPKITLHDKVPGSFGKNGTQPA